VVLKRLNLKVHTGSRERPGFTNNSQERHGLLDYHRLFGILSLSYLVDKVQVAVPYLLDFQIIQIRKDLLHTGDILKKSRDRFRAELAVFHDFFL
jgi:hypothetical protein